MKEAATRHAETIHYSASAGIRVGSNEARKMNEAGFWPLMLEGLAGVRLRKEEVDRAEKRVGRKPGGVTRSKRRRASLKPHARTTRFSWKTSVRV